MKGRLQADKLHKRWEAGCAHSPSAESRVPTLTACLNTLPVTGDGSGGLDVRTFGEKDRRRGSIPTPTRGTHGKDSEVGA